MLASTSEIDPRVARPLVNWSDLGCRCEICRWTLMVVSRAGTRARIVASRIEEQVLEAQGEPWAVTPRHDAAAQQRSAEGHPPVDDQ
jgi:hypothetical protein